MPQLRLLAPIAGKPPDAAGAVRLRAAGITKLNPCQGVVTLRDQTILRFQPVTGASQYDVEVRSLNDHQIFSRAIERAPLAIPAGVLAAGKEYVWRVRVAGGVTPVKSEGRFRTLDGSVETARQAFAARERAAVRARAALLNAC